VLFAQSHPQTYTSLAARITGVHHYTWLAFDTGSLNFFSLPGLASNYNPHISTSQVTGNTDVSQ
jgi:hypothetical protein